MAFLYGYNRVPVYDPHLFLRWYNQLDTKVTQHTAAMLSHDRSMRLLTNGHPTVERLINASHPFVRPESERFELYHSVILSSDLT